MVTEDERRRAAVALRAIEVPERVKRKEHPERTAAWYELLCGAVDGRKDPWYGIKALADRLAALVDPEPERTCHPVLMDWTGNPPYYTGGVSLDAMTMGCSECGCPFRSGIGNLPNYCPSCGAKVVEE